VITAVTLATVVVLVAVGPVTVLVTAGTGYLLEQYVCAGLYGARLDATTP
jgi:hypothetical protein